MPPEPVDPVRLAQALIRRPSITPADAGALKILEDSLEKIGFVCQRLPFGEEGAQGPDARVENLYARFGTKTPNFCFAGHTDVVPPGPAEEWEHDPFSAKIQDGVLYGRGASDMKGSIAAFVAAAARFISKARPHGSISLLITGDEEGPSRHGTVRILEWMASQSEVIDACLVGEPTNPETLGDMMKVGRRGSVNAILSVQGVQGHVAYPEYADNPIPRLIAMLASLLAEPPDEGDTEFQPSHLGITSVDVGNPATNVTPPRAEARFNIRFGPSHDSASLERWIRDRLKVANSGTFDLDLTWSGPTFLTPPGDLRKIVADAVEKITGHRPMESTSGGTSDARYIQAVCPVVEFGGVGKTMHKANESVAVEDIIRLTDVYEEVLVAYFTR